MGIVERIDPNSRFPMSWTKVDGELRINPSWGGFAPLNILKTRKCQIATSDLPYSIEGEFERNGTRFILINKCQQMPLPVGLQQFMIIGSMREMRSVVMSRQDRFQFF